MRNEGVGSVEGQTGGRRRIGLGVVGEPHVGLGKAFNKHAHERLVETNLGGFRRRIQGLGFYLDDSHIGERRDRRDRRRNNA